MKFAFKGEHFFGVRLDMITRLRQARARQASRSTPLSHGAATEPEKRLTLTSKARRRIRKFGYKPSGAGRQSSAPEFAVLRPESTSSRCRLGLRQANGWYRHVYPRL